MTGKDLDVAIIGAGTAGLSARSEVAKITDSYRVFDPGPLGTTCARDGCMPSKAFVQSAHDFHRRLCFADLGIQGAEALHVDRAAVLAQTRKLRDRLVDGVLNGMEAWQDTHLVRKAAKFLPDGSLEADGERFRPRATVIATGSQPIVPSDWRQSLGDRVVTTDTFFDLEELPARMAVIGLGPIGLELGLALARLGVEVTGFDPSPTIGGLADPDLQQQLREMLNKEMRIVQATADPKPVSGGVRLAWEDNAVEVDCVLAAMGRAPNTKGLDLQNAGVRLDKSGQPQTETGQLNPDGTRIYFAGDVSNGPALLHEAADEGRVAGYCAARDEDAIFRRRVPLQIVFTDPQIAMIGATRDDLSDQSTEVAIGTASFASSGRGLLARGGGGGLRIYAQKTTARLLGGEIFAPEAEHIAHLLAHAIEQGVDLCAMLRMPFYHPTYEEVLRRALRKALKQCAVEMDALENIRCSDTPVDEAGPSGQDDAQAAAT